MSYNNAHRNRRYRFVIHGRSTNRFFAAERRRRAEQSRQQREAVQDLIGPPLTFAAVADPENLLEAIRDLKWGGHGAGLDGVTYGELGRADQGAVCRSASRRIHDGSYRPDEPREVQVEKVGGGKRTLRVRSIIDRTIGRVVAIPFSRHIDRDLLSTSYGFRPGRNASHFLADLVVQIDGGRLFLAIDDIRKAFDRVAIARVLPLIERYVPDPRLMALIEVIVRGGDPPEDHAVGIDQGCALSPAILNLQLHSVLDLALRANHELPVVLRYADNLCAACTTEEDAVRVIDRIRELLLPEGHTLKGEGGGIFRLEDGHEAELLGYVIQYADGQVRFRPGQHSLDKLQERLEECLATTSPVRSAKAALLGWIRYQGPILDAEEEEILLEAIRLNADYLALQEAVDYPLLRQEWREAQQRWRNELKAARGQRGGRE